MKTYKTIKAVNEAVSAGQLTREDGNNIIDAIRAERAANVAEPATETPVETTVETPVETTVEPAADTKKESAYLRTMHLQQIDACSMSQAYKAVKNRFADKIQEYDSNNTYKVAVDEFEYLIPFELFSSYLNTRYERFGHKESKPWSVWYINQLLTKQIRAALSDLESCAKSVRDYAAAMEIDY